VSAKLVEAAGFPVVYMTGYGVSASRLGMPDMGFAGLGEMADQARNLATALSIPVIADADTGYGNALTVRRTVQLYEAAGVAALHLEDQQLPKRCGHLAGKTVVTASEFAAKIRAAVEARQDPDLMIIARTDAIAVSGFDDALRRGEAAATAGADMLFIEAPTTEAQIEQIARTFDAPLLFQLRAGRTLAAPAVCPSPGARLRGDPAAR
jgi:2-methylisocitrate lyase-like PEP mutase family enzyme